jgi:hypothetical protein
MARQTHSFRATEVIAVALNLKNRAQKPDHPRKYQTS